MNSTLNTRWKGILTMSDTDFVGFADDIGDLIPDSIPDNTYLCELTDISNVTKKENDTHWLIIKFTVIEEGDFYGEELGPEVYRVFSAAEYKNADNEGKAKLRKIRRKRLSRLESLGVPRDKLAEFDPEDLRGMKVHVSVRVRPRDGGQGENFWIDKVLPADSVGDKVTTDF